MEEKGRRGSKRREFHWYHRGTAEDEDDDDDEDEWGSDQGKATDPQVCGKPQWRELISCQLGLSRLRRGSSTSTITSTILGVGRRAIGEFAGRGSDARKASSQANVPIYSFFA
jgi:hypothetical protein